MSWISYSIGRFSGVHRWPVLGVPRGTKGLSKQLSVVVGTKAYQMGIARMAQTFFENREMDLQIFVDIGAAMSWVSGLKGANQ